MLGRTHRFHGQKNLRRVYKEGKTVRGTLISLRYLAREGNAPYRVAVVVSRQVNKSAVIRNRIRRRIYEQVRGSGDLAEATDLVFTVYSDQVIDLSPDKLSDTITELLQKTARRQGPEHNL